MLEVQLRGLYYEMLVLATQAISQRKVLDFETLGKFRPSSIAKKQKIGFLMIESFMKSRKISVPE